jgi:hypothetical protein
MAKTPVLDCGEARKIQRHGTLFIAQVSNVSGHARAGFHFRFGLTRGNSNGILIGRRWSVFDRSKDERHSLD